MCLIAPAQNEQGLTVNVVVNKEKMKYNYKNTRKIYKSS